MRPVKSGNPKATLSRYLGFLNGRALLAFWKASLFGVGKLVKRQGLIFLDYVESLIKMLA